MNSVLLALILLVTLNLADSMVLRGIRQRFTAEKLRKFQQLKRQSRGKKFYLPDYPQEPLVTDVWIGTSMDNKKCNSSVPFKLAIETAQYQMWTLSPTYSALTPDNHPYDANKSKTSQFLGSGFNSKSETFEVNGNLYVDVVKTDNFTVFNQTFGQVETTDSSEESWCDPQFDGIDGVLGLAWCNNGCQDREKDDSNAEPIRNILNSNTRIRRQNKFYVVWLGDVHSTDQTLPTHEYDWQITFGLTDHKHCERHFNMTPLYNSNLPIPYFRMDEFTFGNYQMDISGSTASVDTGSPVIYMPLEAYNRIFTVIGPTYDWDTGMYTVDCKNAGTYDPWVFTLDEVDYAVPSSSYVVDIGLEENQCVLAYGLSNTDYTTAWVLGTPWLIERCILFDIKGNQIGFAKPKTSCR